jgi:hypothetical protein
MINERVEPEVDACGQAQWIFITLSANLSLLSHRDPIKVNPFLRILMDLRMVSVYQG